MVHPAGRTEAAFCYPLRKDDEDTTCWANTGARQTFPEIAQAAAQWAKAHPAASPADLARLARRHLPGRPRLVLADEPAPLHYSARREPTFPTAPSSKMEMVMRLPVARRGALMPDAHLGYTACPSAAWPAWMAPSPSFVGYDISCMMQLSLRPGAGGLHGLNAASSPAPRGETSFGWAPASSVSASTPLRTTREGHSFAAFITALRKRLGSSGGGKPLR